jgi:hypothetical protein
MSKSRRERERKKQRSSKPPPCEPRAVWTLTKKLVAGFLAGCTALGVIVLWPRMSATVSGPFDPSNAYSETFTIANAGFFPFMETRIGIGLCSIETETPKFLVYGDPCAGNDAHLLMSGLAWAVAELRRDETFSVALTDVLTPATEKYRAAHPGAIGGTKMMSPLKAANIILKVMTKPWPGFWEISYRYRFVAEEQPNQQIMWRAVPLSWKDGKIPK